MPRHLLSKTSYLRSLQCLKALYMYKYRYKMKDPVPPALQARFDQGHDVGRMAQRLFPGGVDCSPAAPWQYAQSVALTEDLVRKQRPVVYEAAFQSDEVLAVADILLRRGDAWFVYEVKSSTAVSDVYLEDAALQYHVIARSDAMRGQELAGFSILCLSKPVDEIRDDKPEDLFVDVPVLDACREREPAVAERIAAAKEVLLNKVMPDIAVGEQCLKPYRCDFYGYCHGE